MIILTLSLSVNMKSLFCNLKEPLTLPLSQHNFVLFPGAHCISCSTRWDDLAGHTETIFVSMIIP